MMYLQIKQQKLDVHKLLLLKHLAMKKYIIPLFYHALLMSQSLIPFLILKRKTLPKEKLPSGAYIYVHSKDWMDEGGMKIWLEKVWSRRHPVGCLVSVRSHSKSQN